MFATWIGRTIVLAALGCSACARQDPASDDEVRRNGAQAPEDANAVEPAFSDLRYQRVKGPVERIENRRYVVERRADMAGLIASPQAWTPPQDLPRKTGGGEETYRHTRTEFDRNGNMTQWEMFFPEKKGALQIALRPAGKGVWRMDLTAALPPAQDRSEPWRSKIGHGERRWTKAGVEILETRTDDHALSTRAENVYDAQARLLRSRRSNVTYKDGKTSTEREEEDNLEYDGEGRGIVSKVTQKGRTLHHFTRYSNIDRHGNPARTMVLVSTSADRDDTGAVESIELSTMAYDYYDETR